MLKETIVEQLTEEQKAAVVKLWNNEYPTSLTLGGIDHFDAKMGDLTGQEHIILTNNKDELVAWMLVFDFTMEGQDIRWFIILLDRSLQRQGVGTQVLNRAKERNDNLNGWMIYQEGLPMSDNAVYPLPIAFYKKHGFTMYPDIKWDAVPFDAIKISWQANA